METNETPSTAPQEQKPKRDKLFLILFLLMTLLSGALGWLYWTQKNETDSVITDNIQITAESDQVKGELQQLKTEYEALQTNDAQMQKDIEEKKAEIEKLQAEAEKHKNDSYIIAKLKKETKTLRDIMKHYVTQIDSLNTANKKLTAEKDSVSSELHTEKKKSSSLQSEKEKLYKMGSVIKAGEIKAVALNIKSKTKESDTEKAKRTDKIKIEFKLSENKIAPKGKRDIYIRIVTPDGKEWTESADADHMFTFNNSKGYYAAKKSIDYSNEEMNVEVSVKKSENQILLPGKYVIDINMDNLTIGNTSITLE